MTIVDVCMSMFVLETGYSLSQDLLVPYTVSFP